MACLTTLGSAPGRSQTLGGLLIRDRNGWMPDEHHDMTEIALSSCHGSAGSSFACGKLRAMKSWMAVLSVSGSPSTSSSGTLCLGLSFR